MDALSELHDRYARSGDAAAMEELVRRTKGPLWRAARRACGEHDAEDAVQGAYQALLRRGTLPPGVPLLGWLLTACVRIAWRRRALAGRHVALADRLAIPDDEGPARLAERSESARILREAVARLPARYRDPIVLHHLVGMQVAEVARLMELPPSTVKTRLRRGRALLESRLSPLFAASLLLAPWALADVARSALSMGGMVMKVKSAAAIGFLALATGAVGYAAGARSDRATMRSHEPPREEASARPEAERAAPPAQEQGGASEAAPVDEAPTPPQGDETWEGLLAKAAEARGVPAQTVEQVKFALWSGNALRITEANGNPWVDHHLHEFQQSMDALLAAGADGFAGALAVLDTGVVAPILPEMLARTCPAGGEAELMRAAADAQSNLVRAQALEALGGVDTPGVAEFLARRVREESDTAALLAALDALVRRGGKPDIDRVEPLLRDEKWQSYHRRIFALLGAADPETLVRWARDAEFPSPGSALDALARVDAKRARLEAAAILDGPRAPQLHEMQRARLRVVAGRW